ncbi:MAG: AraC family transcriptional regulator [Pseudomonadota bacterium]
MTPAVPLFRLSDTHGILRRPGVVSHQRSDELGWTSMFAAAQREAPYEDKFDGVPAHLIVLHLDGPVAVSRNLGKAHDRKVIAPGGLFILPAEMDFGVRLEGRLDSLHIYLRRQLLEEVAADFGMVNAEDMQLQPRLGERDPMIEGIAVSVREALADPDPTSPMYIDYLARMLAAQLLCKHSTKATAADADVLGGLSRAQLERAIEYMDAHLGEPISLAQLAAALDLSPSHFAKRFKASAGAPPHQHLMGMRVERAKRMLQCKMPIAEIAIDCGFAHQEHLTRVFRRFTGATPAKYRRDHS